MLLVIIVTVIAVVYCCVLQNLPEQPTYEETFMQTVSIPGTKCQVKPAGKIAYYLYTASLLADINVTTISEEA